MKTRVAIVGGGPAGLLLSRLLYLDGVDNVVIERRSREHVLSRIRAGVLEQGLIDLLHEADVDERLKAEGEGHGRLNNRVVNVEALGQSRSHN